MDIVKIEDLIDSDPDIEFIEKDSGISSLHESKDETLEMTTHIEDRNVTKGNENFNDEPDETISERLWGLTEMFPEPIRNFAGAMVNTTAQSLKTLYKFSCNASWIIFTSTAILFAPVVFETELARMKELERTHQKQVLLGPGSAMTSIGGPTPEMPSLR